MDYTKISVFELEKKLVVYGIVQINFRTVQKNMTKSLMKF